MTHAIKIRDEAFERLVRLKINGRGMTTARKAPIVTLQPNQLPALGVFIHMENETQLDPGKGVTQPRFKDTLTLGLSWAVMAHDEELIDGTLDTFVQKAKEKLLCDPRFLELFEFTESVTRNYVFSKVGESYIAEIRLALQVSFTITYEPHAPYDLELIDIKTESAAGTTIIEVQIPVEPVPSDED
jgi:hypothetical protein